MDHSDMVSIETVCVTGAGGFIASWLIKLFLKRGYFVKGTVRNLVRACSGVLHVACPVVNDSQKLRVRRVVFTSTMAVTYMDPNRNTDKVVDETCWSDINYVKIIQDWHCYGKILAENTAWEVARKRRVDLVTGIAPLTIGPLIQPNFLNGRNKTYGNAVQGYVHVKDIALAHILVYENPSASGRYLCIESVHHRDEIVSMLLEMFPNYPIPTNSQTIQVPRVKPYKDLGLKFTTVKQALYDTVISFQQNGHLTIFPESNTSPDVSDCQSWPSKPALAIGSSTVNPRL
ncbi:hypothetical protein NE237_022389 [Protea cynaroides]|uniref:NAD-dependent epimerase/dehydratase domain-containing protein n=1 Tax=Protea cynaroides TaxID=273540 RepID=A0A9Q0K584_9MAGN|nr:hypothetical protein NE237_022389 [Protea cynaroides]